LSLGVGEHLSSVDAELDQLAEIHERRVVGDARRLLHVVGDDDDRVVRLELVDQLLDLARWRSGRAPSRARRAGAPRASTAMRARDAQALLLAAGQADAALARACP
jgi:hypothetical protein